MILASHGLIASQIQSFVGLLDLYPSAAAAYSVRKLRAAYTGSAIRVRRSSDNTEQNIGFDAMGNLDTSALTTFCGANNGFVTTWYDQSGNSRDATQTTASNQPQIVSSGSVLNINSKPSIAWNAVSGKILKSAAFTGGTIDTSFSVVKINTQGSAFMDGGTTNNASFWSTNTSGSFRVFAGVVDVVSSIFNINTQSLMTAIINGTSSVLKVNTTQVTNRNFGTNVRNGVSIGALGDINNPLDGNIQELIFYPTNQFSNSSNIQSNINTYYGIY
jgi:hypothetical protein